MEFSRAQNAIAKGLVNDAKEWLFRAAEKNDSNAILALGYAYRHGGFGVGRDVKKAMEHYKRGAGLNHPESMVRLAYSMFQNGEPIQEARDLVDKAWQSGDVYARAFCLLNGLVSVEGNAVEMALELLQKLEESKEATAQIYYQLGFVFEGNFREIPKQPTKARQYFLKSAERGHCRAQYCMAQMSKNEESIAWHLKAAEQGNPESQLEIADMTFDRGVLVSWSVAAQMLCDSVLSRNRAAAFFLETRISRRYAKVVPFYKHHREESFVYGRMFSLHAELRCKFKEDDVRRHVEFFKQVMNEVSNAIVYWNLCARKKQNMPKDLTLLISRAVFETRFDVNTWVCK